jgi:hypothetical protein
MEIEDGTSPSTVAFGPRTLLAMALLLAFGAVLMIKRPK